MAGSPISGGGSSSAIPNPLPTTETPPSEVKNGEALVVTSGTRVPLVAAPSALSAGVVVRALMANGAALVYVGNSTVTIATGATRGQQIAAGESVGVGIDDLNKVYIDADTSGAGVTFIGS